MLKPTIGNTRTFDRFEGEWEIKEIIEDKILNINLSIDPAVTCPHCGRKIENPRIHTFRYIEKLEYDGKTKYLGISAEGRYVILNDFFSTSEIESRLK